ncbi:MAG: hypothetical protein QOG57_4568 [Pseudonocardiales bacterium]|jgi:hypothetical protein|nr:hypothetical protein [Pseudonocardiales bacterium]
MLGRYRILNVRNFSEQLALLSLRQLVRAKAAGSTPT